MDSWSIARSLIYYRTELVILFGSPWGGVNGTASVDSFKKTS